MEQFAAASPFKGAWVEYDTFSGTSGARNKSAC
jgi:hypothetical protein